MQPGPVTVKPVPAFTIALALSAAVFIALFFSLKHSQRYLEFSVVLPHSSWIHLYTSVGGETAPFKYKGIRVHSDGKPVQVRFPLLPANFDALILRFDRPEGPVLITGMKVVNGHDEPALAVAPEALETSGSGMLSGSPERMLLSPTGLSSMLDLRIGFDPSAAPVMKSALQVFLTSLLLWATICGGAALLFRYLYPRAATPVQGSNPAPDMPRTPARTERSERLPLLAAGVFLVIFGARLLLVRIAGTDLPFWDQWDAEAIHLYLPYFDGTLSPGDLFAPHNEHRIALTRLAALGLLLVNGTWDPLLQMTLNAALYAATGAAVFWLLRTGAAIPWGLSVALLFSLPFGWQNTLGGFQLQMYLLVGLSFLFFWLLTDETPPPWRWAAGSLCAVLLLFTMASGFLAPAALGIMSLVRLVTSRDPSSRRKFVPILILTAAAVLAGLLFKTDVAAHARLKVDSPVEMIVAFAAFLGWPLSMLPTLARDFAPVVPAIFLAALLVWMPFACFFAALLKESQPPKVMPLIVVSGIWLILQAAATAYARGGFLVPPSRYQDMFALGALVNGAALLFFLGRTECRFRFPLRLLAFLWLTGVGCGLLRVTEFNLVHDLPDKMAQQQASLEHVREFLKTGDQRVFADKPQYDVPHPDREKLALLLSNRDIRRSLSPGVGGTGSQGRLRPLVTVALSMSPLFMLAGLACLGYARRGAGRRGNPS